MRISDWSSDVCSSDLACHPQAVTRGLDPRAHGKDRAPSCSMDPRVKHEDDKRIGGAACALNAGPGTKCRDDNLELKALRRSAAGDAHVAGDGRLLAAAVDDEVVALGLAADGLGGGGGGQGG